MGKQEERDSDTLSLVSGGRPSGRSLFILLAVAAALLLLALEGQTEPGSIPGAWWNEPGNAPAFSLSLTLIFSVLAAITAIAPARRSGFRGEIFLIVLSAAFLAAVWSISTIGYGLAVLLFSGFCAVLAGYGGKRLVLVSLGISLGMVLLFRVILGLWFPTAELYKAIPWLTPLGRFL